MRRVDGRDLLNASDLIAGFGGAIFVCRLFFCCFSGVLLWIYLQFEGGEAIVWRFLKISDR